ncbi:MULTISPECIES: ribonuclease M5 [Bacillus]|uniref:ribonuclease M5 n=1 Tax=Bacillus TaxID=1386 RepID=UPI002243872F|nr:MULTISPECIES: ribonuclease M5 [Bacillus]MDN5389706.1 ribonuclease M5 [Bacillus sp. LB7]MEC1024440.1 ribonuclease M5 [Bacillus paralicheniformis]MEC1027630.1 ribonuclease M5 [Bacillus paralicheniformis]MEC1034099.1 ribonuclease M5 [Bacillus paralicheniformis]MEC1053369.1 ribonuclease M5 [Bacillus paralicheniformis]
MKIKEIIVVEGRDDTAKIKSAVDADTIETNGSAIGEDVIKRIRLAQETRGVIILTDPDFPGEKIRKTIAEKVPGCKHAFLPKHLAKPKNKRGIGVEHASLEAIRECLKTVQEEMETTKPEIEARDLIEAGLIGGPLAKQRRERLGEILNIGYTNGKQLQKRLQMFQIKKSDYLSALDVVLREEEHE